MWLPGDSLSTYRFSGPWWSWWKMRQRGVLLLVLFCQLLTYHPDVLVVLLPRPVMRATLPLPLPLLLLPPSQVSVLLHSRITTFQVHMNQRSPLRWMTRGVMTDRMRYYSLRGVTVGRCVLPKPWTVAVSVPRRPFIKLNEGLKSRVSAQMSFMRRLSMLFVMIACFISYTNKVFIFQLVRSRVVGEVHLAEQLGPVVAVGAGFVERRVLARSLSFGQPL